MSEQFDSSYDVVVIGGGASGLSCAVIGDAFQAQLPHMRSPGGVTSLNHTRRSPPV